MSEKKFPHFRGLKSYFLKELRERKLRVILEFERKHRESFRVRRALTGLGAALLVAALTAGIAGAVTIDASGYIDMSKPDCGLQAAIDDCASGGGGTVNIPAGRRKSAPVKTGIPISQPISTGPQSKT